MCIRDRDEGLSGSAGESLSTENSTSAGSSPTTTSPQVPGGEEEKNDDRNDRQFSNDLEGSCVGQEQDSDNESNASDDSEDDFSDVSEDELESDAPPSTRTRSSRRLARKRNVSNSNAKLLDEVVPSSMREAWDKARKLGPLTLERQRELKENDELEPSALIRPTRYHPVGAKDNNRPEHLKAADRRFLKAAFKNNYKIVVDQSYQKRKGSDSCLLYTSPSPRD